MLFAIRRAGKHGSFRLAENANRIAFIDGDENAFIDDRIAIKIEKHEVCGSETAAGQDNGGGICDCGIGNFRIADDNLAYGTIETENAGMVHRNTQYVFLSENRMRRASHNDAQAHHKFRQFSG